MIKATELRVGNLVNCLNRNEAGQVVKYNPLRVSDICLTWFSGFLLKGGGFKMSDKNPEEFTPIPLTPGILEKCAFAKTIKPNEFKHKHVNYYLYKKGDDYYLGDGSKCIINKNAIKYVHQLQNLYFDVIGSELNIKNLATA